MALYSFYLQGQVYPKDRTLDDLEEALKQATTLTADHELCDHQIRSELVQVDSVSSQMRTTLVNLQEACTLSQLDELLVEKGDDELLVEKGNDELLVEKGDITTSSS
jgi:hypothetical protein